MRISAPAIALAILLAALDAAAFPAADDPALSKLLDTPNSTEFAGRFSRLLLEIPPADLPAFRETLAEALLAKKLPRRHSRLALGLTDTRWAETDTPGFIAACRKGIKELPMDGPLRAAVVLLETDVEAAIRAASELKLDSYGGMSGFLTELVAKNPARAVALFKELKKKPDSRLSPQPMIARWAEIDPQAAWNGLTETPGPDQQLRSYRGIVCATAARQDPAVALRLIGSLADPADKARAQQDLVSTIVRENIPVALDLCRRINSADAWKGFAEDLRAGSDEETIRILLDSLPEARLDDGLTAFFTRAGYPTEPGFPNARMLPLLEDPARRRDMIVAIGQTIRKQGYIPLPDALLDAALAMPGEVLSEQPPQPVRELLFKSMLRHDPVRLIPWLLAIREAEWNEFQGDIGWNWPQRRYPQDIPAILENPNPRARKIGLELAERWLRSDPAAAFPVVVKQAPEKIDRRFDFAAIVREHGNDPAKVESLLHSIADPAAKESANRAFATWRVSILPPKEAVTLAMGLLEKAADRAREDLLSIIARREEPDFDRLITAIPGTTAKEKDALRATRAAILMQAGHEPRALKLWQAIASDEFFFSEMESSGRRHEIRFTDWKTLLNMIAARPGAEKQTELIERHATALVKDRAGAALEIAASIRKGAYRNAFIAALKRVTPAAIGDLTWQNALKLGLNTSEGRRIGAIAIQRMAEENPKAALAAVINAGGPAMIPEIIQPVMRRLVPEDPAAAFAAAKQLDGGLTSNLVPLVIGEWTRLDPPAVCKACLELPATDTNTYLFGSALNIWLNTDAPAAREWVMALPQGANRQTAITRLITHQAATAPELMADLFLTQLTPPFPVAAAREISRNLAARSYRNACRFALDLDGKIEPSQLLADWRQLVSDWLRSDPENAAAFVKTLPASKHADALAAALAGIPEIETHLAGWQPPATSPKTAGQSNSPLDRLRRDELDRQSLTPQAFAELRKAVLELVPGGNQRMEVSAFARYLIRHRMDDQIPVLLRDVAAASHTSQAADQLTAIIQAVTENYRRTAPDRIPAFLDSLAAASPDWLETAVSAIWSGGASYRTPDRRIHPMQAAALLRLPAEKRAAILARSINYGQELPEELTAAVLDPDAGPARLAALAAVLKALAANNPSQALQAAVLLPAADRDPLIRAILDGCETRKSAADAVQSLDDAASRERAQAWLDALMLPEERNR